MTLPCMAIQQPYAELVVRGIKDVENRGSAMPEQLLGQWCAIYASKTLATVGAWIDAKWCTHDNAGEQHWPWHHDVKTARKQCTRGAVIGLVRWSGSQRLYRAGETRSPWARPGQHHWTYSERIRLLQPVPLERGCQSLYWYLDDDTVLALMASITGSGQDLPVDILEAWAH